MAVQPNSRNLFKQASGLNSDMRKVCFKVSKIPPKILLTGGIILGISNKLEAISRKWAP